jgi:hypothetical protein
MTIGQRAAFNTALIVGMIAIIFALATVWPQILGYAAATALISVFIGCIYMFFYMIEDAKSWKKRD